MKRQKELQDILKAIDKWMKKNKGNVDFIADFMTFDEKKLKNKEDDVFNDSASIRIAFGTKEILKMATEDTLKEIKKDKSDFISW